MQDPEFWPPRDPRRPGAPMIPRRDWDYPPWHRWTFQHIREMTATARVWRGAGGAAPLPLRSESMGTLTFTADAGPTTLERHVARSFTDGLIMLHRGEVVHEQYLNGLAPHGMHLCMSVTKSIVGTLCGILAGKGVVDLLAPVTEHVPDLARTAWRGASLQDVLDMASGAVFNEAYTESGSHMQQLDLACGWKPHDRPGWPLTMYELILTLTETEAAHGARFDYRSIETDIAALVIEHATGKPLADLISEEIWQKIGAEEDAYITVDHGGFALADGGFCCSLRDLARFGLMLANGGRAQGRQVVPEAFIAETLAGTRFSDDYRTSLPRGAYHHFWWIEEVGRPVLLGRGVFGQLLHIDAEAGFVAAKFSTWPDWTSSEFSRESFAAFNAAKAALAGG